MRRSLGTAGLRVFALGPLRVDRGDTSIQRWGGEKAGTRQAQGLFAFLFDRGERGVAKDEVLDLIWPDTDVERADLAFHRTLGGLRHTLDPSGGGKGTIRFHNDRYRLDPAVLDGPMSPTSWRSLDRARLATSADRTTAAPRGGPGAVPGRVPRRLPVLRRQRPRRRAPRLSARAVDRPAHRPRRRVRNPWRPCLCRSRVP